MEIYIPGVGQVSYSVAEYVAGPVVNTYMTNMNALRDLLNKSALTDSDYDQLFEILNNLKKLGTNGASDSSGIPYYMSREMAQNLNIVINFLQAAGIPSDADPAITTPTQKLSAIQAYIDNWGTIKDLGGADAINGALNVYIDTRSLQSMIEIEYVKQGNELIYKHLNELSDALQTLQGSLDQLQLIQTIANNITVISKTTNFKFPPDNMGNIPSAAIAILIKQGLGLASVTYADPPGGLATDLSRYYYEDVVAAGGTYNTYTYPNGLVYPVSVNTPPNASLFAQQTRFASALKATIGTDLAKFEKAYQIAASANFTQIFPTPQGTQADATSLIAAKNALINIIASIEQQNANLVPPITRSTINTLPYFLNRVVNDISAAFLNNPANQIAAVNQWILDNQDKKLVSDQTAVTSAGSIQNNITQAIRTAENLNDTKKEEVNQYMFIFQEFYKSSSTILQKVSQMVERMAQTISR